jgi:hypothetical protein
MVLRSSHRKGMPLVLCKCSMGTSLPRSPLCYGLSRHTPLITVAVKSVDTDYVFTSSETPTCRYRSQNRLRLPQARMTGVKQAITGKTFPPAPKAKPAGHRPLDPKCHGASTRPLRKRLSAVQRLLRLPTVRRTRSCPIRLLCTRAVPLPVLPSDPTLHPDRLVYLPLASTPTRLPTLRIPRTYLTTPSRRKCAVCHP